MLLRFFSLVSYMPADERAYYTLAYTVSSGTLTVSDNTVSEVEIAALHMALNPELSLVGFDVDCDHVLRILPMPTGEISRPYSALWISRLWRSPYAPVWDRLPCGTMRLLYRSAYSAFKPPVLSRFRGMNTIRTARRAAVNPKPFSL